ncbi:unnamed protein product [Adineta steineri]|uniref:Uncharacterized protein n=1 Tax=Adineta steineri TaxID=433720 RepID=A0A819EJQ7_9BILA|nr:unnamed protein product [Adineta steineri]CAF3851879.1 unnamed protein product [Adineta steineri]
MSSNPELQQKELDRNVKSAKCNTQVLRTIFSSKKQMSLDQPIVRTVSNSPSSSSSSINHTVTRTSSTPTVTRVFDCSSHPKNEHFIYNELH